MTIFKTDLPAIGVGDGFRLAGGDTGWWFRTISWLAGGAMVADFLPLFMFYKSHRFFTKNLNFIRADLEDFCRTGLHTLATTVTPICVNNKIPVSGTILKTVVGNHTLSNNQ